MSAGHLDSSKSIAQSRQLSYLIVSLGVIAFFLAWAKSANESRWLQHTYLQKVIVVSDILGRGGWASGDPVTPFALAATFNDVMRLSIALTNSACSMGPDSGLPKSRNFRITYDHHSPYVPPMSHFDTGSTLPESALCRRLRSDLLNTHPLLPSSGAIQNARLFTHINFPGDNVPGCSFVVFRGGDQHYSIQALYVLGAPREIDGSNVYVVFFNTFCMAPKGFRSPVPFVLIDDTRFSQSWYCGIPDWAEQLVMGDADTVQDDDDSGIAESDTIRINNQRFDMRQLLNEYNHEFLRSQVGDIPDVSYIENIDALRSRVIADAAEKSGVLYTRDNWEKAVSQIFSDERGKESFLGVTLDSRRGINIAPVVMLLLTILLWHSVRRIDFSKKPFEEPWILIDSRDRSEGALAALWVAFMLASVAAVIWAVLVYNHVRLPRLGDLQLLWNFGLEWSTVRAAQWQMIRWDVVIGVLMATTGVVPLLGVIHLILRSESKWYSKGVYRMRFRRKRLNTGHE